MAPIGFYHDEAKNDGEYIMLQGEAELDDLRLPEGRTWCTHQGDRLLGTDTLESIEHTRPSQEPERSIDEGACPANCPGSSRLVL